MDFRVIFLNFGWLSSKHTFSQKPFLFSLIGRVSDVDTHLCYEHLRPPTSLFDILVYTVVTNCLN